MSEQKTIYCLNLMTDWKSLESAVALEPKLETNFLSLDFEEASYEMKDLKTALVFVFVNSEKDLTILEKIKNGFKREFNVSHKFIVVKQIRSGLIETKIEKMGFNEIIELAVNFRSLRQKIDRWISKLQEVGAAPVAVKEEPVVFAPKTIFLWQESTDNFDDFWVIKEEKSKKVLTRFSIKVFGPGPYVGRWVETARNNWKFEVKEEMKSDFLPLGGYWTYTGNLKPEFLWQESLWVFAGEELALRYVNPEDQSEDHKFYLKDGLIFARKNSMPALNREKKISETFEVKTKEKPKDWVDEKLYDMDIEEKPEEKEPEPEPIPPKVLPRDDELFRLIDAMVEDEERIKFRQMCTSPQMHISIQQGEMVMPAEYFDIDQESIFLRTHPEQLFYSGVSEVRFVAKYQTHEMDVKFKGDLEIVDQSEKDVFYRLVAIESQRKLLAKIGAFLKVRKKLANLFIKMGRV